MWHSPAPLFVLFSCCSRYVAFVELIQLNDLINDVRKIWDNIWDRQTDIKGQMLSCFATKNVRNVRHTCNCGVLLLEGVEKVFNLKFPSQLNFPDLCKGFNQKINNWRNQRWTFYWQKKIVKLSYSWIRKRSSSQYIPHTHTLTLHTNSIGTLMRTLALF